MTLESCIEGPWELVVDFTHTTLENRFSVSLKLHSPAFLRILHKTNKKFGDFSLNVDRFSLSQRVVADRLWDILDKMRALIAI